MHVRRILAVCGIAAAGAVSALAQPVVFSAPSAGAEVRAGDEIVVRWAGVPADAREVELLLSVDGGRSFALRLTEEIDARSSEVRLRVPNLTTDRATLALRVGTDGRETVSALSAVFSIVRDPSLPALSVAWRGGELWAANANDPDEERHLPAPDLQPPYPALRSLVESPDAAVSPRGAPLPGGLAASVDRAPVPVRSPGVTSPTRSRVPVSIPPRI